MDDFGVRVRAARVAAGLTQLELARAMGYSTRSTISRIESGDNQVPMDRLDRESCPCALVIRSV